MNWRAHVKALQEFINDPSPSARVSAQWRLEAIEEMMEEREEEARREQEEIDQWSDSQEADLMRHESHAHAQAMCD